MSRLTLVLGPALALLLSACGPTAEYTIETPPPVSGPSGELVVGTTMVIVPYLSTDQIEGGPQHTPVDDIRSDDPSIVRLEFTTHLYDVDVNAETRGVLVYAVHEGTTNLRLFNGDSDVGTVPISVVAAGR